jgi:DEAD/DEAH box helicase domain-containing protein
MNHLGVGMNVNKFFEDNNWTISHSMNTAPRDGVLENPNDLKLSPDTAKYLSAQVPDGIYRHQYRSIEAFQRGENVCLATGTASGKSLSFHLSALEVLQHDPKAKVLALYPLRALGYEQEQRWKSVLSDSGMGVKVGRIDGQIPVAARAGILNESSVVIMTPDVLHAWFLLAVGSRPVQEFLSNLRLLILDEVHTYTGVFGSNSAFLFRRLQHLMALQGNSLRFTAASATIKDPKSHLRQLTGADFTIIGSEDDSSPRHPVTIHLVDPPETGNLFTHLPDLMKWICANTTDRFITFVDSRRQTELLTTVASRGRKSKGNEDDLLGSLDILPYRAGYEEEDRLKIQSRLGNGSLGIVSTSALELGLDIPDLSICILVGVPLSATSYLQRIGRIGRRGPGLVLIVNSGNLQSRRVFQDPEKLHSLPSSESALYLENQRIQYIHAQCLVRSGGEHDAVRSVGSGNGLVDFHSSIDWPPNFLELCKAERIGRIPKELRNMKSEAGDDPNHAFPLRAVDIQFQVEFRQGPNRQRLGTLSYSQMLREAYPGAVYYYATGAYRVTQVKIQSRLVIVRREKQYTTQAQFIPTVVYPDQSHEGFSQGLHSEDFRVMESNLQIREHLSGFKERRGRDEFLVNYPLDGLGPLFGCYCDRPTLSRTFFTTGIVLTHPALQEEGVKTQHLAELLYEAFLMVVPLERNDLSFAASRFSADGGFATKDCKFICIYDQTYGSLRLSSRLMDSEVIKEVLRVMEDLAGCGLDLELNSETQVAMNVLKESLQADLKPFHLQKEEEKEQGGLAQSVPIILPGSKGLAINKGHEEFHVQHIFFNQILQKLCYRGLYADDLKHQGAAVSIWAIDVVIPILGETLMGFYDLSTGEIRS